MGRLISRIVMLVVALVVVSPFIVKDKSGRNFLNMEEIKAFETDKIFAGYKQTFAHLKNKITGGGNEYQGPAEGEAAVTKMYRWQDESGEWHYSDVKPMGKNSEQLEIDNTRNVMEFEDVTKAREAARQSADGEGADE